VLKIYYRKIAVSTVCVIALLFTGIGYSNEVTSDQNKLRQVQNTIRQAAEKLSQNQKREKSISEQIKTLDSNIRKTELELGEISKEITITQINIDGAKKDLEEAEANIGDKKEVVNSRLRVMYKNGNVGYVEVLLSSTNIVDLFSRLDMMKLIFDHDVDLLKHMKHERDLIETKKSTLESHENKMNGMLKNMEVKQNELEVSRGEMTRLKEKVLQDNVEIERQIDELNKYAESIAAEIRRKQSSGEYRGGKMAWPTPGYTRITSPFGFRIHPILKSRKLHTGIDIAIPSGKNIVAAGDGEVIHSGWLGGYGKVIMLDHGGGIVTLYAHNSSLVVEEDDVVKRGDVIAKAGSTGLSTGPHLHFEVRRNGEFVDPIPWVKGQ